MRTAAVLKAALFAVCAWLVAMGAPVAAATHVLLAGVTRYDHFPAEKQLNAPGNDVIRMRDALRGWGVDEAQMTILADAVPGAGGRPTLANIRHALSRLGRADVVARGDWVVVYLSGHGATATDTAGLQMSGLNSLFLPADARLVPGEAPQNALYDTEIGAALARIRALGAHVWFVNDSCHAGDSVRSEARSDVHDKSVMPPARGRAGKRPPPLAAPIASSSVAGTSGGAGRLVAFYAAQVTEAARELNIDGRWVSAFTLALTQAMAQADALNASSRDARTLASRTVLGVRALRANGIFQTPYADDDLADGMQLLGDGGATANAAGLVQARAEGMGAILLAGVLDGFETGAEIDILTTATQSVAVARARVSKGGLSRSEIEVINGALPERGWFARLALPAPEKSLTVAVAPGSPAGLTDLVARLTASGGRAGSLTLAPAQDADVLIGGEAGSVRLMPRKALHAIVEVATLARGADGQWPADAAIRNGLLRFDLLRRIERAETLAAGVSGVVRMQLRTGFRRFAGTPASPCAPPRGDARAEPLSPDTALYRCDAIEVEIRNQGQEPRFIQVLAIHGDGTIQAIAPRCGGRASLRLEPGQATAARQRASAESALPVVWFLIPKPRLPGVGRMAVKVLAFPIDAATTAPDPCQFERFNGAATMTTRGALAFEDDARSAAARPGEILIQSRILEWPAQ